MREWLTVIIVLLIVGILLDGWRRMRQSRRDSIKMSRNIHKTTVEGGGDFYGSELPNGGARVVNPAEGDPLEGFSPQQPLSPQPAKVDMREQVGLDLGEEVPMLMEPVLETSVDDSAFAGGVQEGVGRARTVEPVMPAAPLNTELAAELMEAAAPLQPKNAAADIVAAPLKRTPAAPVANRPVKSPASTKRELDAPDSQEVLVINVMASRGQYFQGAALLDLLLDADMRFGDMDIFHRHRDVEGQGPVLFSMANMVKPGTFDLHRMSEFSTPGVSMFLTLPLPCDSLEAFNIMASTAKYIVDQLGGELKDEQRSVMTNQTLEHCRQRIREFERKRLV